MLHVGALLDRTPGRKYTAALRFAELSLRAPLPRPGTLASARAAAGEGFVFALRAPRNAVIGSRGALRSDAELDTARQWLNAAADALQARAVIIHTPADLTPGARSRDLLREYFARLPRVEGRHYVWAAQGAWEPEEAQALCAELGVCRAFDPLETLSSPGAVVYATLRALGHRAGFSYAALSDALSRTLAHQPEEAFISVDAERSFDVARRLATLSAQAQADAGVSEHAEELDADEGEAEDDDDEDADDAFEDDEP